METMNPISQCIETNISTELNWNSSFTMIFLLSGSLQMQLGPKIYSLNKNDFIFFKPFELFCSLSPSTPYRALVVTVDHRFLEQICPGIDQVDFKLRLVRSGSELPAYHAICRSLSKITYHGFKKTAISPAKICSHVCDILTILIDNFGEEYGSEDLLPQSSQIPPRLTKILRYINDHYASQISLDEISSQVGLHPQYFSTYFKKQFGTNFSDYLNSYRINRSLPALLSGRGTILDVALANGFNNHKTYGSAFLKQFGCSPREYRALYLDKKQEVSETATERENEFHFLQRFWNSDSATIDTPTSAKKHLTIHLNQVNQTCPKNHTKNYITVGRAMFCLRADIQNYLRKAREDHALDYVRIQDIFSDSLLVYYEDKDKTPIFNWTALDQIFDFLLSIGVKPYPEIGYMPTQLASKRQYAGWQYHPNVSFPKSLSLWKTLISRFFEHIVARYGATEVRTWLFDFWTLPNLVLDESYWYESKEKFFQFYEASYRAMKSVDSQLQLGSPNFSCPSGLSWYRDFLQFAHQRNIHPAFISARLYCYSDGNQNETWEYLNYSPHSQEKFSPVLFPNRDFMYETVRSLREIIDESNFADLAIIISDWNITFFPADYTRDTSFMGPYILDTYFRLYPYVDGLSYTSLSDINEDFFRSGLLFHGGPGLLDHHGIPKAAYHALAMAHRFSRNIVQTGSNYVIAQTENGYELLLYNLAFYNENYRSMDTSSLSYSQRYNVFEGVHTLNFNIMLPVESGTYTITSRRVNRETGSSYDLWIKMGTPAKLNHELVQYLLSNCTPEIYCETITATGELRFDEIVPPHGLTYISIRHQ